MTLAVSLPLGDWQFWLTTALALAAAVWVLRGLVPERIWGVRIGKRRRGSKKTTLTIKGERPKA